MDTASNSEKNEPSLGHKILTWSVFAGFTGIMLWLARSVSRDFKKAPVDTTARILLEAGPEGIGLGILAVGGAVVAGYDYLHEKKECLQRKNHKLEIENAVLKAQQQSPKKSWTEAEQTRNEAAQAEQLQK